MDYEQKYKDALERAKNLIALYPQDAPGYREVFPELAESEDERIRKWLLDFAIGMIAGLESDISRSTYDGIKGHDPESEAELAQWQKARAYLEKQKEEEGYEAIPVESTFEYKLGFKAGRDSEKQKEQKPAECKDCAMFLKDKCERPGGKCEKKNQKLSWSEEDEERLKAICTYLQDYPRLAKINDVKRFNEYCDWLKSLHPSWKPSEEQMKALLNAEGKMRETKFIAIASKLAGLYEDLKKLIGEK